MTECEAEMAAAVHSPAQIRYLKQRTNMHAQPMKLCACTPTQHRTCLPILDMHVCCVTRQLLNVGFEWSACENCHSELTAAALLHFSMMLLKLNFGHLRWVQLFFILLPHFSLMYPDLRSCFAPLVLTALIQKNHL